jgi:hypothetical protein
LSQEENLSIARLSPLVSSFSRRLTRLEVMVEGIKRPPEITFME